MSLSPPERVRLYVPWLTILKILSAAALVWIWLQAWPILMVVLVIGAELGGIVGALLALPVVAAYPIVERIWLRESLGKNVLAEHARLEREGE